MIVVFINSIVGHWQSSGPKVFVQPTKDVKKVFQNLNHVETLKLADIPPGLFILVLTVLKFKEKMASILKELAQVFDIICFSFKRMKNS
jgi:hypothetical protein